MKSKLSPLLIGIATIVLLVGCQSPRSDTTQWEYKSSYNTVAIAAYPISQDGRLMDAEGKPMDAKAMMAQQAESIRKRPEYQTRFLNEMAKEGWILVSKEDDGMFTFKRPKK